VASPPESADTPLPSTEFAGLASDAITPAFICKLSATDKDEYTTLVATIDPLTTSLDWCSHTCSFDFTDITYMALNQHLHTIIDLSIVLL